jgi:hypothetical protein
MDEIKREYPRKQKNIKAMININIEDQEKPTLSLSTKDKDIRLIAQTKDISWGGFCLKFSSVPSDPENRFTPAKAHTLVGKSIKVHLSNPALTLWGDVIRFDSKGKEMAVIITKVSDYELWQQICNQEESS